jgi:pimeloyl-ACP methyl ester carboxylesterase
MFAALEALPATGVPERQPALLVPGYTGSKEDFVLILPALAAAGRQVVAIDMRGQFETPGGDDPGAYQLNALAADVALIADGLRAGQPGPQAPTGEGIHLLGHSLGGLVAREILLAQAAPVSSLTLMSSGPGALTGPRAAILRGVLAELAATDRRSLAAEVERIWRTQLEPEAVAGGVPAPVIDFLRTRMLSSSPVGLRSMGETLLGCPDRTGALARAGGPPLLVIYGEGDDAWDPATQEDMAARLGAQRVCIPAAAHSPAVEAPDTTASTLTSFWNSVECAQARAR